MPSITAMRPSRNYDAPSANRQSLGHAARHAAGFQDLKSPAAIIPWASRNHDKGLKGTWHQPGDKVYGRAHLLPRDHACVNAR